MRQFKIVIEKHPDGYVAYPIDILEEFGEKDLEDTSPLEIFIAEAGIAI